MGFKRVKVTAYECVCNLPGCKGRGKPWISLLPDPPARCGYCKRYTWNRPDKRYGEKKTKVKTNGKDAHEN